ncbi:MAG: hypothetical protein MUP80_14110 [Acidobacteriia bacterium]|nr:hypothetical protein [Terriglobia bacterium]
MIDEQDKPKVEDERRYLRELRDRKPSPYPKLLMRLGNKRNVSLYSRSMTFDSYVEAYFQAARKLSSEAPSSAVFNYSGLPILFLYRHFVELVLKASLNALVELIREHSGSFDFPIREIHHLNSLLDDLRTLHEAAKPYLGDLELPSKQARDFIRELSDYDEKSYKFRYPHPKGSTQPAIDEDMSFNLDVLDAGMLHVYKELKRYWDTVAILTGLYQDYKEASRA